MQQKELIAIARRSEISQSGSAMRWAPMSPSPPIVLAVTAAVVRGLFAANDENRAIAARRGTKKDAMCANNWSR